MTRVSRSNLLSTSWNNVLEDTREPGSLLFGLGSFSSKLFTWTSHDHRREVVQSNRDQQQHDFIHSFIPSFSLPVTEDDKLVEGAFIVICSFETPDCKYPTTV